MTSHLDSNLLSRLKEAFEASWDRETSYRGIEEAGNIALGQCYPTARVVQHYFPETKILDGVVMNGERLDRHFWNGLLVDGAWRFIDLSWQQFAAGAIVKEFTVLENPEQSEGESARQRCALLLQRVKLHVTEVIHDETRRSL